MPVRPALAALTAVSAAMVLLAATRGASAPAPEARRNTMTITVTFMCDGKRSVDPWEAHVAPGDDIEWELSEDSDAERIRIRPKRPEAWPLDGGTAPEGGRGKARRGRGKIKRDAAKGRSSYDIEARCGREWRRIDPDIIID